METIWLWLQGDLPLTPSILTEPDPPPSRLRAGHPRADPHARPGSTVERRRLSGPGPCHPSADVISTTDTTPSVGQKKQQS